MKRILNKYCTIFLTMLGMVACSESEDTTPSYADTDRMESLIDMDVKSIADFKEAYGTYVLYDFDKNLDFAYQFEQASTWNNATITTIGHDDAVVAMDMLCNNVFSSYNDSFKKSLLPRKILLVGSIASASELGLSVPVNGHHTAVANINSVTVAGMSADNVRKILADDDEKTRVIAEIHRALLADYLIKSRGKYPVEEEFISYSQNYYATLMNNGRKTAAQLIAEDANFFYNHGFFYPDEDESTYFPAFEEDITAYVRHLITMNDETANTLLDMPLMAAKMHLVALGLQNMGIDVMKINPSMEQFLTMEYVQPAVMYAKDAVTDNPKATIQVTVLRGSHAPSHLDVIVNGDAASSIDLSSYDKMRIVLPVEVDGLVKGANDIVLKLYEEGRDRPSATIHTGVSYASMDQVVGFNIKRSDDHEDVYRMVKISIGDGGNMDNEQNPDLTTIAFEKHGYLDKNFMEIDAEYRYWKIYRKDGLVQKINTFLRDGFNEDYTAPLYRLTGSYSFSYNDNGELTGVTFTDENDVTKDIVTDVTYISGRIVSYVYEGRKYEPTYATVNGVTTRVDCLDADMKGTKFGFQGTEDLNPYYMPELPAVIPGSVSEIPLQLLYSQYLFCSLEGVWNEGWKRDIENKINGSEVNLDGVVWSYRFKLK